MMLGRRQNSSQVSTMVTNRRTSASLILATLLIPTGACRSPGELAGLVKENDSLRREVSRLERTMADRDGSAAALRQQIEDLKGFRTDRPADLFAPVSIEIVSRSGGADYDGKPGDDGVTVYLRPRDADGDAVKAPGLIRIQVLDNTDLEEPRLIGVYTFDGPDELREAWHGKFGTQHYTLKCPFMPDVDLPTSRKLLVSAAFVDFLTGATLTTSREVTFAKASD